MKTDDERGPLTSESQVEAMISLLTDASESVVTGCRAALLAHPEMAEPLLRERVARQSADDGTAIFGEVLVEIERTRLSDNLIAYLKREPELEQGSILIGRLVDPDSAGPDEVVAALDAMADQVNAEPNRNTDPLAAMLEVMVKQNGLKGGDPAQARPLDALLHGVTLQRRGLPLPLCIAWILVARRAGLRAVGVNMPGHFLLRFIRENGSVLIDPFHQGRAVSEEHCRAYLARGGLPDTRLDRLDATDGEMLLRTLRNVVMIASRRKDRDLARICGRVLGAAEQRSLR